MIRFLTYILIIVFLTSAGMVYAQSMSSTHYRLESDAAVIGGARSVSASYFMEDTIGEDGAGRSSSSGKNLQAGFQQADEVGEEGDGGTGSQNSSGSIPIKYPVPNVSDFKAVPDNDSIYLSWQNPDDELFDRIIIVRSDIFFPTNISEGEIIYEGIDAFFDDKDVVPGKQYYYSIFVIGNDGRYSSGVLSQARIAVAEEVDNGHPVSPTISDILNNLPMVGNVDGVISSLSLNDFNFIQNNRHLDVLDNNTITINGSEDLTITLPYARLPEVLKTIAFSLVDPEDHSRIFTFLLKANEEKTAYEATIGALGRSGDYALQAVVIDFENQGLKRLTGVIKAIAFNFPNIGGINISSSKIVGIFSILTLSVISLIMIILRRRNKIKNAIAPLLIILIIGLSSFIPSRALSAINQEINYQGKLMNSSDEAVDNDHYSMVFKLYTQATGGSAIWTESLTGADKVTVTDGLFSVMLGSTTPFTGVDFNQTLYLGVTIENDSEMSPRKVIGAVPAAFTADKLDSLSSEQFIRSDAQNATSSSSTFLNVLQTGAGKVAEFFGAASASVLSILSDGKVGIGTTTPTDTLSVNGPIFLANTSPSATGNRLYANGGDLYYAGNLIGGAATGVWSSNGTDVYRATGNVGIGTTSPGQKLSVGGDILGNNIIGSYFTATSTNATSTFGGNVTMGFSLPSFGGIYASRFSMAQGYSNGGTINASGNGSFARGYADYSFFDGAGNITASSYGSLASGYAGANSNIRSSGYGSTALGYTVFSDITSSGNGSLAGGYSGLGAITSTNEGSFAWGSNVNATASFSTAIGTDFTNSTASTFKVGYSSTPTLTVNSTSVGIGTTSPYATLSVVGSVVAANFTATTSTASIFPYASTTALTVSGNTYLTNLGQGWLHTAGGSNAITASTSPTVNYITATSTTATSTFAGGLSVTGTGINIGSLTKIYQNGSLFMVSSTTADNLSIGVGALPVVVFDGASQGRRNLAIGAIALAVNTSGSSNTAVGLNALGANISGTSNMAFGDALQSNTTGGENVGIGDNAGRQNQTGIKNTFVGISAGAGVVSNSNSANTAVGHRAGFGLTTGSNNAFFGLYAGENITSGSNNIAIGYEVDLPSATASNQLNIGNLIFGTGIDGLFGNMSSGKIGIGTTSPFAKLSIANGSLSTSPAFAVSTSTASATSTAFIIDSNGKVGVGTASPVTQLHVVGNISLDANGNKYYYKKNGTSPDTNWAVGYEDSPSGASVVTSAAVVQTIYGGGANYGYLLRNTSGTSLFEVQGVDGKTYFAGNVGLGTTSPGQKLSVAGDILGNNIIGSYFTSTSTTATSTLAGKFSLGSTTPALNTLFSVGTSTQNLFVDNNSGRVVVGGAVAQTAKLTIPMNIGGDDALILHDNTNNRDVRFYFSTALGSPPDLNISGANRLFITTTGGGVIFNGSLQGSTGGNFTMTSSVTGISNTTAVSLQTSNANTVLFRGGVNEDTVIRSYSTAQNIELAPTWGKVGIGTTSPFAQLSIAATSSISSISLFAVSTSTATATSTAFVIDSNGKVGVGTTSPYAQLSTAGIVAGSYFNADDRNSTSTFTGGLVVGNGGGTNGLTVTGNASFNTKILVPATSNAAGSIQGSDNSIQGIGFNSGNISLGSSLYVVTSQSKLRINAGLIFGWSTNIFGAESDIAFQRNAAGKLYLGNGTSGDSSGTLIAGTIGIGTTSPYAKLSVTGTDAATTTFAVYGFNNQTANLFLVASTTGTATSTAFIIDSNGKVGIGTTSPYAQLSVAGFTASGYYNADNASATSTLAGGLNIGSGGLVYDFSSGITSINALEAGNLNFDTDAGIVTALDLPIVSASANTVESYWFNLDASSTPNMVIYGESDGSGGVKNQRVGIGTTTPWRTLSVNGKVSLANLTTSSANQTYDLCLDSNNDVIADTVSGGCVTSSAKFKHNINTLTLSALDEVMALRPVSFYYNTATNLSDATSTEQIGFIAEEAFKIDPRLVGIGADGTPHTFRYENFTSILAKAVQELNIKVDGLSASSTASALNPSSSSFDLKNMFDQFLTLMKDAVLSVKSIFVAELHIEDKLCADDVCITKAELKALLIQASSASTTPTQNQSPQTTQPPQTSQTPESSTSQNTTSTSTPSVEPTSTSTSQTTSPTNASTTTSQANTLTNTEEPTVQAPASPEVTPSPSPSPEVSPEPSPTPESISEPEPESEPTPSTPIEP